MSVLVLVPARGGSKGLPGKNLLAVGGLSLTARAVLAGRLFAARAGLVDAMVMVDTDDADIAAEGRRYGAEVPFLRPRELAQDTTSTADSVVHCIDRLQSGGRQFDTVVLLQPTSPLRTLDDVLACWKAFEPARTPSVASVTPLHHPVELAVRSAPDGTLAWSGGGAIEARRRQDFVPAYRLTGAVYVTTVALLRERRAFVLPGLTRGVVLPGDRSADVDTVGDLAGADALARASAGTPVMTIGARRLGGGAPCFVIAEAGVNHNGDPELAHRLVDVAADAGADAVKFQTFAPEVLAAPAARQAAYQTANTGVEESQLAMLRRLELPVDVYPALKAHAAARGIAFLSSPFDEGSADHLDALGVAAFKIPSGELTNLPFLAHVARKGRPLLVSTGMATMAEVAEAVHTVRTHGDVPLALFHCVTDYPADPSACNLAAIATMRAAFGVPVGWSDHTAGLSVGLAAVARGAEVLEKHFTLDRNLPGPDHKASLAPDELRRLVQEVRTIESAAGDGVKAPAAVEHGYAPLVRKSLHTRNALAEGHILRAADVIALRPGDGLPPAALARLVGRRLRVPLAAGARLSDHDFA